MNEVISIICTKESRRGVMLEPSSINGSAMVVAKPNKFSLNLFGETECSNGSKNPNREELWCTYCKKPQHTKEEYWKLYEKPHNLNRNRRNKACQQHKQAYMANYEGGSNSKEFEELNKEEIERLRNFVSNLDKQLGMCSLAQTSKSSISHTIRASYLPFTVTWVIGSRATSHMIHFSHCFSSYNPCPNNKKIFIVYGSFTTVTSQGKINPT